MSGGISSRVTATVRRLARGAVRIVLRVMPWAVTAGALGLGGWFFDAMLPVSSDSRLALWGVSVVLARWVAALAAISAGAFALSAGLEGRWFAADQRRARRFGGLVAIGAGSLALGAFVIGGPLAGFSIAHSLGVVGGAGVMAGLATWGAWSMRRRSLTEIRPEPAPLVLERPDPADDLLMRDLGRVRTPAN